MSDLKIRTNNVPRKLVYGYELSAKEREDFDYIDTEDFDSHYFVRYKGSLYDVNEFCTTHGMPKDSPLTEWDGYHGDSYFSGILIRFTEDDRVVMGQYFC